MSLNNWTLSISLSRRRLILRFCWPTWTMWWMSPFKKDIKYSSAPVYWMKKLRIYHSQAARFMFPYSQIQNSLIPNKRRDWESSQVKVILQIVLCMKVKREIPLTDEKANQYPKKAIALIRFACGALFWALLRLEKWVREQEGMTRRKKQSFLLPPPNTLSHLQMKERVFQREGLSKIAWFWASKLLWQSFDHNRIFVTTKGRGSSRRWTST